MWTGSEPEDLPHRGLAIDVRAALRQTRQTRETRASTFLAPVLEKMLDPDPDRRASRIAPLLSGGVRDASPERAPRASAPYESRANAQYEAWDRRARRYARHAERDARRAARRAERAARRIEHWRGPARPFFPWPARLLLTLVFTVGIVAVLIATQVVVPLVLRIVSLFVARRALLEAADSVRLAGSAAVGDMQRSRKWFLGNVLQVSAEGPREPPDAHGSDEHLADAQVADPRVRVAEPPARVANADARETEDADDTSTDESTVESPRHRAQR
jgi:hypothetical protein